MDLLEQTRMDDTYTKLTNILNQIGDLDVFPSLVWVWSWDVALSTLRDFEEDEEFDIKLTEQEMFKLFWEQADKNGFTLEYGTDSLYEAIRDWMIDQDIVAYKEAENE